MNCPNCGAEMQSGNMYSFKYPYLTQQKKIPIFRTPKDAVVLRPVGDTTTGPFEYPVHNYPDVTLCKACHTVVFQYQ